MYTQTHIYTSTHHTYMYRPHTHTYTPEGREGKGREEEELEAERGIKRKCGVEMKLPFNKTTKFLLDPRG